PSLPLYRLSGDGPERVVGEREVDALHLEQPLVLLDERILRLGQDALKRHLVEILQGGDYWEAANELRDQPEFQQVLRLNRAEDLARLAVLRRDDFRGEADRGRTAARRDDL